MGEIRTEVVMNEEFVPKAEVTITKKEWDALKSLHSSEVSVIIYSVLANAFDGEEPDFEEWRREQNTAIFNLLKK